MTTEQVARRLVELYNQGKAVEAEQELYAENAVSHEPDGRTVVGLEGIIKKTGDAFSAIDLLHSGGADVTWVSQDTFLIKFSMDFTLKSGDRIQGEEYGFYRVADGKVVEEYFYMAPLA